MITYLGKLTPNLAKVTSHLCTLLKKEVEFKLNKSQLDAIGKLKLLVTTTPCLKIFNPNLQTRLKIDASSDGLGALLLLNYPKWYPAGYASRSLRDYEKYYAQIENETLSIDFGIERFHEYLYGHKFTVINNPQPLKSIFSTSMVSCLHRIQKFFLHLQKCKFYLKYSPRTTMLVLNALSQAYIENWKPDLDENSLTHHVNFVISNLPISKERLEQFKEET